MKSISVKAMLLSAFVLASPLLTFAGERGAPPSGKGHAQDSFEITRTVQQGKATGLSLSQTVIRANANRVQTADEKGVVKAQPAAPSSNAGDPAFHR